MNPDGDRPQRSQSAAADLTGHAAEWLLEPIGFDRFVAEFWDQVPLHIAGRRPDFYADLYSLSDFDAALNESGIRSPFLRLVRDGREIPLESLSGDGYGRAQILEDVFAHHRDGASIVLQFLHEQDRRLKHLSRDLAVALSSAVQVNAYLTPVGEHALGTHYDTHDVFVMQIYGHKYWTLYDRPDLVPFKNERRRPAFDDAKPSQVLTLSPGDCLYVPRGWIHAAESREAASLHLTVGVHPIRWGQVVQGVITEVLRRNPRFRHALPPGFATHDRPRQRARDTFDELWSVVKGSIDAGDLLDEAVSAARLSVPPRLDGHLLDLGKLDHIDQHTRLKTRDVAGVSIDEDDSAVRITYYGKVIECPAALSASVRFLMARDAFAVSELPDMLTPQDKLLLARRLVKEGLLTFADRQELATRIRA